MRLLNLVEKGAARQSPATPRACREVRFGGTRVFLDPGTLSLWAAESAAEAAPVSDGLEPEFPASASQHLRALVLSVTHGCNLACRYCYVRKRAAPGDGDLMQIEVARKALELLCPPGPWRVGFFGGEPLLAWDLVREVVELARERAERFRARVRFSVTTNGTLVTPDRADFLARERFSVILSLDGPKEIHDRERRRAFRLRRAQSSRAARGGARRTGRGGASRRESNGSFEGAMAGLEALKAAGLGPRVTLRSTFPLSRPELRARLEFLNDLADRGYARSVSVEPAWPARGEPAPVDALAGEYLDSARWAASRLASGKRVRFHHLEKPLERVLLRKPAGTECGAGFGYLEVAPSGELHACHKGAGGAIGHVQTGPSERLRAPWRENRLYARVGCSLSRPEAPAAGGARCWARNVCGGGCRAESVEHTGAISKPWPVACAARRFQIRAALHVAAASSPDSLEDMFRNARASASRTPGPARHGRDGNRRKAAGRCDGGRPCVSSCYAKRGG